MTVTASYVFLKIQNKRQGIGASEWSQIVMGDLSEQREPVVGTKLMSTWVGRARLCLSGWIQHLQDVRGWGA